MRDRREVRSTGTAPSANLAKRLAQLRSKLGWPQAELADRMNGYGLPWDVSTVSKVEKNTRKVSIDELVTLAYVLGVSPASLLIPVDWHDDFLVTPNTKMHTSAAWQWVEGISAAGGLRHREVRKLGDQVHEDRRRFYYEALPTSTLTAEDRVPGLRRLHQATAKTFSLAGVPKELGASVYTSMVDLLREAASSATEIADRLERVAKAPRRAKATQKGLDK